MHIRMRWKVLAVYILRPLNLGLMNRDMDDVG